MDVVSQVKQELKKSIDPDTKGYSRFFFKEEIKSLGMKTPVVNEIGKKFFRQIEHLSKDTIFGYCEEQPYGTPSKKCRRTSGKKQ